MKAKLSWLAALPAVLVLVLAGCDQASPDDDDDDKHDEGDAGRDAGSGAGLKPLLPWATGNTWVYRITDDNGVSEKVTTIGEEEPVGGDGPLSDTLAHKVVTEKGAMDQTISWQVDMDGKVVRLREQAFAAKTGALELEEHWQPYKLHVDGADPEHLEAGASWLEEYDETKVEMGKAAATTVARDRWMVVSASESVSVPAGTFDAIVLQKAGGSTLKKYWYARGVGKVKETGGQMEELLSYEVAP